jgi:hypothetical protein
MAEKIYFGADFSRPEAPRVGVTGSGGYSKSGVIDMLRVRQSAGMSWGPEMSQGLRIIDHISLMDPDERVVRKDVTRWEAMAKSFREAAAANWTIGRFNDLEMEELKRNDYAKYLHEKAKRDRSVGGIQVKRKEHHYFISHHSHEST